MKNSTENLVFSTPELEKYFSKNRICWDQFYVSERAVIEQVNPSSSSKVLDIGCGCGGLGVALNERFGVRSYTGVEINSEAAETAIKLNPSARILTGDFLTMDRDLMDAESYDLVFSLSCIDWNLTFEKMLVKAWSMVKPGGVFIASYRLTVDIGVNDINKSYQYINYEGVMEGEIAPYVVINAKELIAKLLDFKPSKLLGRGYYGPPSKTAITPFKNLCFSVIAAQKAIDSEEQEYDLELPQDILTSIKSRQSK